MAQRKGFDRVGSVKGMAGELYQFAAERGLADAGFEAIEQLHADLGLERLNLLAECWLGHAAAFGGAAEMARVSDGDGIAHLPERNGQDNFLLLQELQIPIGLMEVTGL
jgi:hypothetical protein